MGLISIASPIEKDGVLGLYIRNGFGEELFCFCIFVWGQYLFDWNRNRNRNGNRNRNMGLRLGLV